MLLTKTSTFIIGPVATLLGYIMNAIFWVQSQIGIESIGLCIILFTIVIYMLLLPLTIKQQKFSRLQSKMNPELQAIQKKYKGKNQDQAAMMKMNEETQAVYQKYGVNPMGSCLQMVIQMPILFALYRVIWNIPAYVTSVKNYFVPLADALLKTNGAQDFMAEIAKTNAVTFNDMTQLTLIDVLYKFKPDNWSALLEQFPDLSSLITSTQKDVDRMNYFLGLNIADSPASIFQTALAAGSIALITGESIGQVASQTLQSLASTNEVCTMPVFRPVIGFDKQEIVDVSEKIGTYETSIQPYEDCCTIFVAKHPVTKPNLKVIRNSERHLEEKIDEMVKTALDTVEVIACRGEV